MNERKEFSGLATMTPSDRKHLVCGFCSDLLFNGVDRDSLEDAIINACDNEQESLLAIEIATATGFICDN